MVAEGDEQGRFLYIVTVFSYGALDTQMDQIYVAHAQPVAWCEKLFLIQYKNLKEQGVQAT